MSIVALKRKTQAQHQKLSTGQAQFSLNGGYRLQGYIGQTSLTRNLPKTNKRGNDARGFGGCCGKYPIKEVLPQDIWTTENSKIVKPTVLGTTGMLETKYRFVQHPRRFSQHCCPKTPTVWKPDDAHYSHSAASHTHLLSQKVIQVDANNACKWAIVPPVPKAQTVDCVAVGVPLSRSKCRITKMVKGQLSQSEYIARLDPAKIQTVGNDSSIKTSVCALSVLRHPYLRGPLPGN